MAASAQTSVDQRPVVRGTPGIEAAPPVMSFQLLATT